MNRPLLPMLPATLVILTSAHGVSPQHVWQADIQIRTLEITRNKGIINARVVVYTENDDDAQNARLLILLPIGVGLEKARADVLRDTGSVDGTVVARHRDV